MTKISSNILEAAEVFEDWYAELQADFLITQHTENTLVTAVDNRDRSIHNWYSLKEAYSAELPLLIVNHLTNQYGANIQCVLDPFIGGGTTGVSLVQNGINVDGIEYNPFIYFVAKTKSQYPLLKKDQVESAINSIELVEPENFIPIPDLSTLNNRKYFKFSDLQVVLHTIQQVRQLEVPEEIRSFLLLGVSASIDSISNLRKDGRALRFDPKENKPEASTAIRAQWDAMLGDLEQSEFTGQFRVFHDSAIELNTLDGKPIYDLVLYSPPYLNNFDYSEIYKLELWLLHFIESGQAWRDLRLSTVRSHPSIKFPETDYLATSEGMRDIYEHLSQMAESKLLLGENNSTKDIIVGYFDDMYRALKQQWIRLKPGGHLVYIVANSRHKYLPIATDVILGAIAQRIGFEPLELVVLKQRNGRTRQNTYLRESAVILQKQ